MALINCPECGHQVSDKAPTCPSCGVEIAGKITSQPTPPVKKKKKKYWILLLVSFLIAAAICGVFYYFYYTAKSEKETEAYNYAITSEDPLVLQSFLDTYRDADDARRDSIRTRLAAVQQAARDWNDASASCSKTMIQEYLEKYPNSPHKGEALNKIDSIDWAKAKHLDTEEAYKEYAREHPNGAHVEDAEESLKNMRMKELQPDEITIVQNLFRRFFQSVNNEDDATLRTTLAEVLQSFQGEKNVSADRVVSRMSATNRGEKNWHVMGDYQIQKKPTETEVPEYDVTFTAIHSDPYGHTKNPSKYHVEAKVNSEGLIVEMNMSKFSAAN